AQPAQQRDEPVMQLVAGVDRELLELTWQVDKGATTAVRAGGNNEKCTRHEQASAADEDLRERGGKGGRAGTAALLRQLGEVVRILRVAVVVLLDRLRSCPDLAVQRAAVGRRGDDQVDAVCELVEQAATQLTGVAAGNEAAAACALLASKN